MEEVGFIVLRHVNNELTDKYWVHCYDCIRQYYPEYPILIIDDNSNYEYISEKVLYKTTIINSEYPGRGELLPYYYYLHNKLFNKAIIIHDSVFVNSLIDTNVDKYKIIWHFEHDWDIPRDELSLLNLLNDNSLFDFYLSKDLWKGCFGGMSIITHDYLIFINDKYDISKLLIHIKTRTDRMAFERVIACLLQKDEKEEKSLLGNIINYCNWGGTFNDKDTYKHLPLIKVWTGR